MKRHHRRVYVQSAPACGESNRRRSAASSFRRRCRRDFGLFYTTIDFDGRLNADAAARLMRIVRDRFGIDAALATCTQVHGKNVVRAQTRSRECDSCDGLWSSDRGTALGIKVADCLPVTIADMQRGVIANVHSGWRGAVQKIAAETIDADRRRERRPRRRGSGRRFASAASKSARKSSISFAIRMPRRNRSSIAAARSRTSICRDSPPRS